MYSVRPNLPALGQRYGKLVPDIRTALDTHLSDALIREGWTRDIVRRVNDWRKAGGFRVEERITIRYQASGNLAATIRDYRDYISEETLAASIVDEPPSGSGFHAEAQFADQWLRVDLQRTR